MEVEEMSLPSSSAAQRRISDYLVYADLAAVLEKISQEESNDKKKKYLQKYMDFLRQRFKEHYKTMDSKKAGGDSLYCVIRILLPDLDRGRRAYGFKSSSLGRMLVDIFGLDRNSRDGKSLLEFKDPQRAGSSAGNISNVLFNLLKSRFSAKTVEATDKVSLTEIHETLDMLSRGPNADVNQEYQKKILQGLFRKLSALEAKWLVRILLKDMQMGFSSTKKVVYGLLHPQAKNLSERIGDLELLCQKLNDTSVYVDDLDILMFNHFRPMLATRMDTIDSVFETGSSLNNSAKKEVGSRKPDIVSLPAPPFYIETKWDGERFQIHYDGHKFKYFSRRAFDFTNKFDETLTEKLRKQVKPTVQSFIVDGEMMAFNKKYKMFTQKGYNIDVKTMNKDNPNHCPVFVVFDLVYLNGSVLTNAPLKERREKLKNVFELKEDVIRMSEVRVANTKEEVIEHLNSAIDDGEEGLIVKDMNSTYEPGKRPVTWLKIKPEYLEGNSVDDLDLLILGAYYTESTRRGGEITHFLVGLLDTSKGKKEYYPLAKVGSGRLRSLAVKDLVDELKPLFVRTPVDNVYLRARKKPDFMIDPTKSIVVQVKASEIIPSDVYACSYTLRFPRITKIRTDKTPNDVMELKEFLRIREACGGKLVKRTDDIGGKSQHSFFKKKRPISDSEDSDGENDRPSIKKSIVNVNDHIQQEKDDFEEPLPGPSKALLTISKPSNSKIVLTKSPAKNSASLGPSAVLPLKTSVVPRVQKNLFNSKVFCVYGSSSWKTKMETEILKHGGNISQSPDIKDLFAIIGERRTSVMIRKAIQAGKYDVLQPSWLAKCFERGEEVHPLPLDYWAMTQETRSFFADEYDEYGDSYTKECTIEETKKIIKRIIEEEEEQEKISSNASPQKNPNSVNQENPVASGSDDDDPVCCSFSGSSTDFSVNDASDLFPNDEDKRDETVTDWNFMSDAVIAFRGTIDDVLQIKLKFYGGKVVTNEDDPQLSHIVVCKKGSPSREDHVRALVVSQQWLEHCLKRKKMLDERNYIATL